MKRLLIVATLCLMGCGQSKSSGSPAPQPCEGSKLVGAWDYSDWQSPGTTYEETYKANCSVRFYFKNSSSEFNANGQFKDLNTGSETGNVEITMGSSKESCQYQKSTDGRMVVFNCTAI